MKIKLPALFFALLVMAGCGNSNSGPTQPEAQSPRDTNTRVAAAIPDSIPADTPIAAENKKPTEAPQPKPEPQPRNPLPQKPLEKPQDKTPAKVKSGDELHYWANSKEVSVRVTPWEGTSRQIIVYGTDGKVTFERTDHRSSYSDTGSLEKFHPNGALAVLKIHNNPGASMYWYETTITFGIDNYPEWKVTEKFPQQSLELPDKSYWNRSTRQWIRQEIIKEQPVPH